jgi:hypothetical protein
MKKFNSLTVQMVYVAITGLQLIFVPNFLLGLFGLAPTNEIWIRILGLIVFILAILYRAIIKSNDSLVIMSTIWGRLVAGFGIITLSFVFGQPVLSLFALVDIATATWTWQELKK